jgi:hypothetical protein
MRMRRCHIIQLAKEAQQVENKKSKEKVEKKQFILYKLLGLRQ